jgi:glycosyltransferase involved in cell wall biosynthesis
MLAMSEPEVAVVVPTQGLRATLREALASVLAQTWQNFELLVIDDSPADGRPLIADERWRELLQDARVRIVPWHRGVGCSAAKQQGLVAAQAPWVCYLDDDNTMHPDRLRRSLELARRTGAPISLCGFEVDLAGRRRSRQHRESRFTGDDRLLRTTPDTNVLFHARNVGVDWEPDLMTSDDAVFFHRVVAARAVDPVPNEPAKLVVYRVHQGDRANSDAAAIRAGQRRLLPVVRSTYSPAARRIFLRRMLVTNEKFERGNWLRFGTRAAALVCGGGHAEIRMVVNAAGFKLPVTRRWMVR